METIYSAIIAAVISGITCYLTIRNTLKSEEMKILYDYDKILIQERMKYYPKLFEITQNIGKQNKSTDENIGEIRKSYELLIEWRKEGGFLLLSEKSLKYFNDLKVSLKTNPGNGEKGGYTKEQLQKIWQQRNHLRGALKDDIGIKIDNYKD